MKRNAGITDLEHKSKPLLPRRLFMIRVLKYSGVCALFITFSLGIGIAGYMVLDKLNFVDALLNASMILGGMGPVDILKNDAAKVFASLYSLYSGMAFLTTFAILVLPFLHRLLHVLHLQEGKF